MISVKKSLIKGGVVPRLVSTELLTTNWPILDSSMARIDSCLLVMLCEPCPNWKSIMDLIDRQGKNNWNDYDCDRKNKIQCPSFSLSATGLFWCGRLWYWTILRWEILLLDFFAVGDCGTGLFWSGRFCYWTFLKWEILMLDFLASGQMNCTAKILQPSQKSWTGA